MELPKHYLPVRPCPHVGVEVDFFPRILFADYGSHQNVNISFETTDSKEKIVCWPQKGQNTIKNVNNILPLLPLFDQPLQERYDERDSILGVKNFSDTLGYMEYVVTFLPKMKGQIRKNKKSRFSKTFEALKNTYLETGDFGHNFKEDDTLKNLSKSYIEISKAYNSNCLNGFNRDFYSGLLSVAVSHDKTEYLSYAGGPEMKNIYVAAVSKEPNSCLKTPSVVCQHSAEDNVYQIDMSYSRDEQLLVCAREKQNCQLYLADISGRFLVPQNKLTIAEDCWTCTSFSPYLENEILLSSSNGDAYLWDITHNADQLIEKQSRFHCPDRWSCAYFAGHPREIVVVDNTSVEIFDHRSHFKTGQELFSLSSKLITVDEKVMAAGSLDFPYHAVATDFSLFIMDQRFTTAPVFQWYTEFKGAPQYLKIINNDTKPGKLIFLASQQPAEVICFPVNINGGDVPRSSILPWKVSALRDFNQSEHWDYICDMNIASRKFNTSLAGLAVSKNTRTNGFTVFQMDSYGDIFYRSVHLQGTMESPTVAATSNSDEQKARAKMENWLRSFENQVQFRDKQDLKIPTQTIDPDIIKEMFQSPVSISLEEASNSTKPFLLNRILKHYKKLSSGGANTKLLLALHGGADITEPLKERENYHKKQKKKLREENILKKGKYKRSRRRTFAKIITVIDDESEEEMSTVSCLINETTDEPLSIGPTDMQDGGAANLVIGNTLVTPSSPSPSPLLFEDDSLDSSGSLSDLTDTDSDSGSNSGEVNMIKDRSASEKSLRLSTSSQFEPPTYTSTPNKRKPKESLSAQKPKKPCQKVNFPIKDAAASRFDFSDRYRIYTELSQPTSLTETREGQSSQTNLLIFPTNETSTEGIVLICGAEKDMTHRGSSALSQWEAEQVQVNKDLEGKGTVSDESSDVAPLLQNVHLGAQAKWDMTLICETLFKDSDIPPMDVSLSQIEPLTQGDQNQNLMPEAQGSQETTLDDEFENESHGAVSGAFQGQTFTLNSSTLSQPYPLYKCLPDVCRQDSCVTSSQKTLFTDGSFSLTNASNNLEMFPAQDVQFSQRAESASLFELSLPNIDALNIDTTPKDSVFSHLVENCQGSAIRLRGLEIFDNTQSQHQHRVIMGSDSMQADPYQGVIQWLNHSGNQSFENPSQQVYLKPNLSSPLDSSFDTTVASRHTLSSWSPCVKKENHDSSNSDSGSTNSLNSSLPASQRTFSMTNPKMKCFVDPNLAGFLSSPQALKKKN